MVETLCDILASAKLLQKNASEVSQLLLKTDLINPVSKQSDESKPEDTQDAVESFFFQSDVIKETLYNLMIEDQRRSFHCRYVFPLSFKILSVACQ
jgi:hypothetical protein